MLISGLILSVQSSLYLLSVHKVIARDHRECQEYYGALKEWHAQFDDKDEASAMGMMLKYLWSRSVGLAIENSNYRDIAFCGCMILGWTRMNMMIVKNIMHELCW